jgi:hypothetical protein
MAPAYNTLEQSDYYNDSDKESNSSSPAHDHSHRPPPSLASPVFAPPLSALKGLFLDVANTSSSCEDGFSNSTNGRGQMVQSTRSERSKGETTTSGSYDMVENDDFADDAPNSPAFSFEKIPASSPASGSSPSSQTRASLPVNISRPLPRVRPSPATAADFANPQRSKAKSLVVRTASGRKPALRHPTPDLQVLQGAYTGNIEHLERTAERLSMTSSIDLAIKELHDEQKRSDSRRSSLASVPEMARISRQMSNASSIVEVNSAARSGGYSPGGFIMSPKGSITAAGRMRSVSKSSKSSKYGSRPEPEMEGRPLDSLMSSAPSYIPTSPALDRSISIEEQDEESSTLTKPVVDQFDFADRAAYSEHPESYEVRPVTATSTYTANEQAMFEGFDGDHTDYVPQEEQLLPQSLPPPPRASIPSFLAHFEFEDVPQEPGESQEPQESPKPPDPPIHSRSMSGNDLLMPDRGRRVSSGNRLSTARPQSYADPSTGQQMVYYPAPVPMMLNLPQKLSKNPSSLAKNKRRSQVMSNIPAAARSSAIWLPDVLENEPELAEDEGVQSQEYLPQHQRVTMGGRRHTQDLSHLPPQLRASTFFDIPAAPQNVELKEQSAVATLDSILDASAHAPVSAFTDHAFAGHLGSEVYGKPKHDRNRSSTQLLDHPQKKRTTSFNILKGRRASSQTVLLDIEKDKKRASSAALRPPLKPRMTLDDDEEEDATGRDGLARDPLDGDQAIRPDSGELGELGEDAVEDGEFDEEGGEGEEDEEKDDLAYHGAPTTLLAELQLRKQQQKLRTRNLAQAYPQGMHSTLLQMDAVAQVEQRSRKQKKVNLAWEATDYGPVDNEGSDDDVPLAILYSKKAQDRNRPVGLLERREMEDNEPLSKRRERITGRPAIPRAVTMSNVTNTPSEPEVEGETLGQRIKRLKEKEGAATGSPADLGLPKARPISGDFASEMMSQFGGDLLDKTDPKGKGKEVVPPPEDETLGQRRKRLQAEREAAETRPGLSKRHSMATLLQAHPSAGATPFSSQSKPSTGLLGMHEQRRSSTLLNLDTNAPPTHRQTSAGYRNGTFNDTQGGIIPPKPIQQTNSYNNVFAYNNHSVPQFAQPTMQQQYNFYGNGNQGMINGGMMNGNMMNMGYNPYAMGMGMQTGFMPNPMLNMQQLSEPLNQGQIDMVERWRQSVMQ